MIYKFFFFAFIFNGVILITEGVAQTKSSLFFREDWKEIEAELPVNQNHVANDHLILNLHGPGKNKIKKSNHPHIPNDPFYIWSGECDENWAVSLRHKSQLVDLSGPSAYIKWQSKQSGFRQLRIILKLANGTWLVSDHYDNNTEDWLEKEFKVADIRWRTLNINRVIEENWMENPDLTRVEEVGFTDLMVGGQSRASSRLDWIEVYGKTVTKK
jgi:hypothetical protein